MRSGAWMLDTFMRITPMKSLLDRGLSQADVLDRRLSTATWDTCWSDGAFVTCLHPTRDSASLHPCRQAAYFLPCTRPPDACGSCLDRPRHRRPQGSRDHTQVRAFVITRAGTATGGSHHLCSGLLATFFEDLTIRRHFLFLLLSATSGAFSFILSLYLYFAILPPFTFVISMFDILAHRLFIGRVQCLCASCLCVLCFYSVFFHLLLLFIPPAYFFPLYPCMHPYVLHHPSPSVWRAPYLEGPICLAEHILSGGLSTRRALRLEGCFSVFLCFSLFLVSRGWINFLFIRKRCSMLTWDF